MQQRRRFLGRTGRPLTAIVAAASVILGSVVAMNSDTIRPTDSVAADPISVSESSISFDSGDNVVVNDPAVDSQGEDEGERTVKQFTRDEEFSMFALTWDGTKDFVAHFRAKDSAGNWGPWYEAEPLNETSGGEKDGTELIYLAPTHSVQVSVTNVDLVSGGPTNLDAVFIDGNSSTDPQAGIDLAADSEGMPSMISRAGWGADESKRCMNPTYDDHVSGITVHHTAGSNNYTAAQAAAQVRGIYHYHAATLGWCDIGYNALVDKFGNIYEGRAGGLNKAVQGAHAGGFNQNTWGISMIGDYSTQNPTAATIESMGKTIGWRAAVEGLDPTGSSIHYSEGSHYTKYAAGTAVKLPNIFAHRDVGNTTCPGDAGYSQMLKIRTIAKKTYDAINTGTVGTSSDTETSTSESSTSTAAAETTEETSSESSTADTSTTVTSPAPSTAETSTESTAPSTTETTAKTTSEKEPTPATSSTTPVATTTSTSSASTAPSTTETTTKTTSEKEPTPATSTTTPAEKEPTPEPAEGAAKEPTPGNEVDLTGQADQEAATLFSRALGAIIDHAQGRSVDVSEILDIVGSILALVLNSENGQGIQNGALDEVGNIPMIDDLSIADLPVFVPKKITTSGDSVESQKYNEIDNRFGPVLGSPLGGVHYASPSDAAGELRYVPFTDGVIISSPEGGTHALWGDIADAWASTGLDAGILGLPTSDQYATDNGYRVDFVGGYISYNPTDGSLEIIAR
ncbi:N-acetylmuramoyl-L-alanine amidase [Corynebacterium sp. 11A]|uniref:N-acetylmuramoyl-L-alanine amidase n=1 Tax=Corynebacterium sp. 11A TaxID=2080510 RepID=UPI00124D72EC|nr:N-acetylmuramoyl-L-alanine amidase [Corynebacterium sp. 11A]